MPVIPQTEPTDADSRQRLSRQIFGTVGVLLLACLLLVSGSQPVAPNLGAGYTAVVRIIALRTLREFWTAHTDAEDALRAWYADARQAEWGTPGDIRATYANASILSGNRVVFNIRGNTYRLIVALNYPLRIVYIRFVGTHAEGV